MPLYEFECEKCKARFEELTSPGAETSKIVCPECGSKKVRRLLSTFSASAEGGQSLSSGCGPSSFT